MEGLVFPLSEKEAKDRGIKRNSNNNRNAMFPSRLRELRATCKSPEGNPISQQMLSDIKGIGITKSTISLYEVGENIPDAKRIVMLANYFGVSTDYLLCKTDIKTSDMDIRKISEKIGLSEKSIQNIFEARNNEPRNKFKRMPVLNSLLETWSFFSLLYEIARFIIANEYAAKELALLDADEFNNLAEIASLEKEAYKISGISEETDWNVSPRDILLFILHNKFEGIMQAISEKEVQANAKRDEENQ